MKFIVNRLFTGIFFTCLLPAVLFASEMEPRRWTHLPIGASFIAAAAVHTNGDIFADPVLRIVDGEVEANTVLTSYLHSFDLLGKSARVDVRLPYQRIKWQGLLDGDFRRVEREGMGDPFIRLSVNFLGAPALKGEAYRAYRSSHTTNTLVGAALGISVPLGQYKSDKLLNIGENRYIFRPQLGFVHTRGPWSYELTGTVNFFTDNNDFWGGKKREQDPLYVLETHLIYTFSNRIWTALSGGYDWGGQSRINGVDKDDYRQDFLYAISLGSPISHNSSVKFAYINGKKQENIGTDTENFVLAFSLKF